MTSVVGQRVFTIWHPFSSHMRWRQATKHAGRVHGLRAERAPHARPARVFLLYAPVAERERGTER